MPGDEAKRVHGIKRFQDCRMDRDVPRADGTERKEPDHHHRPEDESDKCRALLLDQE